MKILIPFYSHSGHTAALADRIARGVELEGADALLRQTADSKSGLPTLVATDFEGIDGIALGSACHFGGMAGSLKQIIDQTTSMWLRQSLRDKPFIVFTSAGSAHSGLESTLISMAVPLLHHGMIYLGAPLDSPALARGAGSVYGANSQSDEAATPTPAPDEAELAQAAGRRLARIAKTLANAA